MIVNSTLTDNIGLLLLHTHTHNIRDNKFQSDLNTLLITGCEFRNNSAEHRYYAMHVYGSTVSIADTKFTANLAITFTRMWNSSGSIIDSKFINNCEVETLLGMLGSVTKIDTSVFEHNEGSAISLQECTIDIFNSVFTRAYSFSTGYSALMLSSTIMQIYGSEFKNNNGAAGAAIYCGKQSLVIFNENCTLAHNHANQQGGAMYLDRGAQCFIADGATVIIANNMASEDGGGIYLNDYSSLTLSSCSVLKVLQNSAIQNGGGIYGSEFSFINLAFKLHNNEVQTSNSMIYLYRNQASKGGGLYLGFNATVDIYACLNNTIIFKENYANYGGAVYIFSNQSTISYPYPECFFQSLLHPVATNCKQQQQQHWDSFQFSFNQANTSGVSLFKSVFEYCVLNKTIVQEFTILSTMSNIESAAVGSIQVRVCYCVSDAKPDCTKQIPFFNINTGEKITFKVAIINGGDHIVNGSVESEIKGRRNVITHDDQMIQDVINGCTPLSFNIYSFKPSQQLILSPYLKTGSLYKVTEISKTRINLNFLACIDCPIGFQKTLDDAKGCDCVCNTMLEPHISNCNYTRETITKKSTTAWIGFLSIENTSDYLIYPYCPTDYCLPPDKTVEINLNIPNGADAQCAHNRSGLLCGACSPGLSLSLGSSRCLQCHTHWPRVLVAITISSLIAGIILVTTLLMLNLTVAFGTLNGLILYANIVAANQHKFFPSTNFITVFVSWINLELGIDTCFFDGMDFYWKTWIQLAFPAYILLLVVLVIIISEHSVKFAEMVAKGNPLATLNTLILLSYVKFLCTIILAFSFATLDYPDGSHPAVWWPDATVGYFSGKQIFQCAVAAVILVVGIFYTATLFLWQWLLYYQHKRIFKWIVKNQRLCMFVEPNHAPYAFKHRYWAGLLLLVRIIVYTISTADVSSDRSVTLLAIGIITFLLTILVCTFQPYKRHPVQAIEVICYANIVCFCFATLYVSKVGKSQDTTAYISGTTSLVLFLIVLSYHVITQLFFRTWLGKKLKNKIARRFGGIKTEEQVNLVVQDKKTDEPVTYSEVDLPRREEEAEPLSHSDNLGSRKSRLFQELSVTRRMS